MFLIGVVLTCLCTAWALHAAHTSSKSDLLQANIEALSEPEADDGKKYILVNSYTECSYTINGVTTKGTVWNCREDNIYGTSTCRQACVSK